MRQLIATSILILSTLGLASTAVAQMPGESGGATAAAKPGGNVFRIEGATIAGSHDEDMSSEYKGTSSHVRDIPMAGTEIGASLKTGEWYLFGLTRQLTPQENLAWWQTRTELFIGIGRDRAWIPFGTPTFSYFQMTNVGDGTLDSSPAAFLNKTQLVAFGWNFARDVGFGFMGGHKLALRARYQFLTSFQRTTNYGRDTMWGVGYAYQSGAFTVGLTYGAHGQTLKSMRPDPEDTTCAQKTDSVFSGRRIALHVTLNK